MKNLCIPIFLISCYFMFPNSAIAQYSAPSSAESGSGSLSDVVGTNAGNSAATGGQVAIFGASSGSSLTSGFADSFFGASSGTSTTSGSFNSFFGTQAGRDNTEGKANSFFGSGTGQKNTTGNWNSVFGQSAARENTSGSENSFFGNFSGLKNTTASRNSFFGANAGLENKTGANNSFFGYNSGDSNITGDYNSFFGLSAGGMNTTGSNNTFVGVAAGRSNSTGESNVYLGRYTGFLNETGSECSYVGFNAGFSLKGSHNVCLGSNSGPSSTLDLSDRLFIDVERSDEPLIYGEFDTDFVKINGTFEVTAGLSNPSDVNLKNNFELIDEKNILEKVATLDIQKWTYKTREGEFHVGATAQDFYKAFGLGADDKHISTIDADGIALASIKALKIENDELRKELSNQKKQIDKLLTLYNKLLTK